MCSASVAVATGGFAATGVAVAGGVSPLLELVPHRFTAAPSTSTCERVIGLACYSPKQFQTAYEMNSLYKKGLTGAGKTIAIVDSFGSPTVRSDLATFDQTFGLAAPPKFTIIKPDGPIPPFDPNNSIRVGWAEETSLDVQYAHAMAPGANILLVETPVAETEGLAGIPQIVKAENYVINHHLADVISQSFGATEQTFPTKQSLLNQRSAFVNAAKNNVSVLAATGDAGSTDYLNPAGTELATNRAVIWPSTDPLVTAVGGTQLHLNNGGQRTLPDNVWNDTNELGGHAAGGGGRSIDFARPSYQDGVRSVVHGTRGVPDVSLSAAVDGAALVQLGFLGSNSGIYLIGGTSEATPLFAGVTAVADQAAGTDLGTLNPELYALAAARQPGIADITTGNNTLTFTQDGRDYTVPGFNAVPGYDLASGLGTVNGASLVSELADSAQG